MPGENFSTRRQVYPAGLGLNNEAELGRYFRATHQTPGTAYAASLTAAWSATAAFMSFSNGAAAGAGPRATIDYIRLVCTVAPASATAAHMAIAIDTIDRYASGGTAIVGQQSASDFSSPASLIVRAGPIVAAAPSANVRIMDYAQLRAVIPVVGDMFGLRFGEEVASPASVLNGTNPSVISFGCGPIVIAPQHSALLHLWFPGVAVTPASFAVEVGWIER